MGNHTGEERYATEEESRTEETETMENDTGEEQGTSVDSLHKGPE